MDCLSPSRWVGLALVALTLPGCFTTSSDDDDSNPKTDASDDSSCFSEFTLEFPDGTSTSPDYCQAYTMKAQYEFDPDEPPEIRTTELQFHAVTDEDFECWIQLLEPDACGTGYYRLDAADGMVTFDTHDCTGVPDDYEDEYSSASGYVRFDQLYAGDEAGNFSGEPLETTVSGYLSVWSDDGILLSGDFSMTKDVKGTDSEEVDCAVSDGDDDDDGFPDEEDCGPLDPGQNPDAEEECDGVDNDCDGDTDEGVTGEWFQDLDGDGFGNPDVIEEACSSPEGFAAFGSDCDDTEADAFPG
ncbi:MAG: putative metal-binding motif-containing protein, partial [Myxococcota bacterium]|nr:putative metal-binding motif-containing protein [Myxococcota bacterium]